MRRNHLLIGNWKMNLGPTEASAFSRELRNNVSALHATDMWIAPPAVSMVNVLNELRETPIKVGAQNVHWASSGAFTGETSALFLQEMGATFSLVGHSERRTYFGETSEMVADRTRAALATNLAAVVCIGESESDRVSGRTERVLLDQLAPVFQQLAKGPRANVVLAYEPVWAIGTGRVASLEEIATTHQFIGSLWQERGFQERAVILYGGSVNPQNFAEILAIPEVDGALVGGASIKIDQWLQLIAIAEATPLSQT